MFYSNDGYEDRIFSGLNPAFEDGITEEGDYPLSLCYERCFNPETDRYEFDSCNCPVFDDGDDRYCEYCRDHADCYSAARGEMKIF